MGGELVVRPTQLDTLTGSRVTALAAGFAHTLFLTRPGRVLACGADTCGQCGLVREIGSAEDVLSPTAILATVACAAIAAGNYHSCSLARDDGGVFTWGEGRFGRLGHGTTGCETSPRMVQGMLASRRTDRMWRAVTACIDEHGGLTGSASWNQCGHGSHEADELGTMLVRAWTPPAEPRLCGEDHMLALGRDGEDSAATTAVWARKWPSRPSRPRSPPPPRPTPPSGAPAACHLLAGRATHGHDPPAAAAADAAARQLG